MKSLPLPTSTNPSLARNCSPFPKGENFLIPSARPELVSGSKRRVRVDLKRWDPEIQSVHDSGQASRDRRKNWIPDSLWLVSLRCPANAVFLQSAKGDRLYARLQSLFGNDNLKENGPVTFPITPLLNEKPQAVKYIPYCYYF